MLYHSEPQHSEGRPQCCTTASHSSLKAGPNVVPQLSEARPQFTIGFLAPVFVGCSAIDMLGLVASCLGYIPTCAQSRQLHWGN